MGFLLKIPDQRAWSNRPSHLHVEGSVPTPASGAGIMGADDRQVTTFFTVHSHSTIGTRQTEYHEVLPASANDEVRGDYTFADETNPVL